MVALLLEREQDTLLRVLLSTVTEDRVHALPSTSKSKVTVSENASSAPPLLSVGMVTMSSLVFAEGACLP